MTTLARAEQWEEACGSLDALRRHGHSRAAGLFAYPNNKWTDQIQRDVVSTCFAFGRQYSRAKTLQTTGYPFFQKTLSVNGGRCNNVNLPCFDLRVTNNRQYTSPDTLIAFSAAASGQWATIQWYRLVRGSMAGSTNAQWDCTSADWRRHWTSQPELYCFEDFMKVMRNLPSNVVVTDPSTVATAWGRRGF